MSSEGRDGGSGTAGGVQESSGGEGVEGHRAAVSNGVFLRFAQSKHSVSFDIHRRGGAPFGTDCGDIDCTLTVKRRSVFPKRVVGDRL